jgi:hypothetical protein
MGKAWLRMKPTLKETEPRDGMVQLLTTLCPWIQLFLNPFGLFSYVRVM